MNHILGYYIYLQGLDLLSTMAFLKRGVAEANPLVRWCIEVSSSPMWWLLLVKFLALGLGLMAWKMGKRRALAGANVFFAVLVVWNLVALILTAVELG